MYKARRDNVKENPFNGANFSTINILLYLIYCVVKNCSIKTMCFNALCLQGTWQIMGNKALKDDMLTKNINYYLIYDCSECEAYF